MPQVLLSRDQFRYDVGRRDNARCVICGEPAVDAHHIVERRLFPDGGYYIDNGAMLCPRHHLEAESTELGCDEIRRAAGITHIVFPPHIETDIYIDKWGNEILSNGKRIKGELFYDESVQRVLRPVLHLFIDRVRYPRTYHLPWSETITRDDYISDLKSLRGRDVVVTLKMDGENTTLARDYVHARSPESKDHPSRHWIKNLHSQIGYQIPVGWRICGENLYAKHSIYYSHLKAYFQVFSFWDEFTCVSWQDTVLYAEVMGLTVVPVLWTGNFDQFDHHQIWNYVNQLTYSMDEVEGYVIRVKDSFHYRDFRRFVAKFVRPNHIRTQNHWMQSMTVNQLDSS